MEESKIAVEFSKVELQVLIHAVSSSSPIIDDEVVLFKLYHKLRFKLNEVKS